MAPSRQMVLERAAQCPAPPCAVEVFWDGDTGGWFIVLTLIYTDPAQAGHYREHDLAVVGHSDVDPGMFNGEAPLWREAAWASEVGAWLAEQLGLPLYFPSPHHPEDNCPRWWQQDQGYACRRCGVLLLQEQSCAWRGICYFCHLDEEREQREAQWTPEERAGPRCQMCGNPAKGTLGSHFLCATCLEQYDAYQCSRCGSNVLIAKTRHHTDRCTWCELEQKIDSLPEAQREALRRLAQSDAWFDAIQRAEELLSVPSEDAVLVVSMMTKTRPDE